MSSAHIIKLRGGWKRLTDSGSEPFNLPCPSAQLASLGPSLTLVRRFQHPPRHSPHQVARLFASHMEATTHVELDGQPITAQALQQGHRLSDQSHQLTITIQTENLTTQDDWGHVWISIEP